MMKLRKKSKNAPVDESDDDIDEMIEGKRAYNVGDKLSYGLYKHRHVKECAGKDVSYETFLKNGFDKPIVVKDKTGLGLTVPSSDFTVENVMEHVGADCAVEVINTVTQVSETWDMQRWVEYYNTPKQERKRIWNVISLEFTGSTLDPLVASPAVVREVDWVQKAWPLDLLYVDVLEIPTREELTFPKVLKYCLMSVAGCYTDFHIDLGGTSVWYHILKGQKMFWLIPPTEQNIQCYIEWSLSGEQEKTFLADKCTGSQRITLNAGYTFFIPTGWIHAVFTPVDSLVFGGNFLHSFNIGLQLRVVAIEDKLRVGSKYKYPFFEEMQWYVYDHYNVALTGKSFMKIDDEPVHSLCAVLESKPVLSKFELQGLKNLREWLPNQNKETYPDEAKTRTELLDSMMVALAKHSGDDKMAANPSKRSMLQWKPNMLRRYQYRLESSEATSMGRVSPKEPSPKEEKEEKEERSRPALRPLSRRMKCGKCAACLRVDCRKCTYCRDLKKYGGRGYLKQTCAERRCVMFTSERFKEEARLDPKQTKLTFPKASKSAEADEETSKGKTTATKLAATKPAAAKTLLVKQEPPASLEDDNSSVADATKSAMAAEEDPHTKERDQKTILQFMGKSKSRDLKRKLSPSKDKMPSKDKTPSKETSSGQSPTKKASQESAEFMAKKLSEGRDMSVSEFGYSKSHVQSLLTSANTDRLSINGGDIFFYTAENGDIRVIVNNSYQLEDTGEDDDVVENAVVDSDDEDSPRDNSEPSVAKSPGSLSPKIAERLSGAVVCVERMGSKKVKDSRVEGESVIDGTMCVKRPLKYLLRLASQANAGELCDRKLVFLCVSQAVDDEGEMMYNGYVLAVFDTESYLYKMVSKPTVQYVAVRVETHSISLPLVFPKASDLIKCQNIAYPPIAAVAETPTETPADSHMNPAAIADKRNTAGVKSLDDTSQNSQPHTMTMAADEKMVAAGTKICKMMPLVSTAPKSSTSLQSSVTGKTVSIVKKPVHAVQPSQLPRSVRPLSAFSTKDVVIKEYKSPPKIYTLGYDTKNELFPGKPQVLVLKQPAAKESINSLLKNQMTQPGPPVNVVLKAAQPQTAIGNTEKHSLLIRTSDNVESASGGRHKMFGFSDNSTSGSEEEDWCAEARRSGVEASTKANMSSVKNVSLGHYYVKNVVVKQPQVPQTIVYVQETERKSKRPNATKQNKANALAWKTKARTSACGECKACLAENCKMCNYCKDMKKYGGPGKMKQRCMYKRCTYKGGPDGVTPKRKPEQKLSAKLSAILTKESLDTTGEEEKLMSKKHKTTAADEQEETETHTETTAMKSASKDSQSINKGKSKMLKKAGKMYQEVIKAEALAVRKMPNCSKCIMCLDKKQFGGPNTKKQMCMRKKEILKQRLSDMEPNSGDGSNSDGSPEKPSRGRTSSRKRKLTQKMEESLDQAWNESVSLPQLSDFASSLVDSYLETIQDDDSDEEADDKMNKALLEKSENDFSQIILNDLMGEMGQVMRKKVKTEKDDDRLNLDISPMVSVINSISLIPAEDSSMLLVGENIIPIFRFLPRSDLLNCSLVCKAWYLASKDCSLWKTIDLTKRTIDELVSESIITLQPKSLILNKAITSTSALETLLSGIFLCTELSMKGVSAVTSLGLMHVPSTVTSLNISGIPGLNDLIFCTLFNRELTAEEEEDTLEIEDLDISSNEIGDASMKLIAKRLTELRTLNISSCSKITNVGLSYLANMRRSNLREIEMSDCEGVDVNCLKVLATGKGFTQLRSLNFNGCANISLNDIKGFVNSEQAQGATPWKYSRRHLMRDL